MQLTDHTFSTRSLWASAYLLLKGHKLLSFELITPHTGHFLFQRDASIDHDIAEYYSPRTQVQIRDYLERYSVLRDMVMREKRLQQTKLKRG